MSTCRITCLITGGAYKQPIIVEYNALWGQCERDPPIRNNCWDVGYGSSVTLYSHNPSGTGAPSWMTNSMDWQHLSERRWAVWPVQHTGSFMPSAAGGGPAECPHRGAFGLFGNPNHGLQSPSLDGARSNSHHIEN